MTAKLAIALVGLAVGVVPSVVEANAVVRENGPIYFFGSRAPDYYTEIYSVAADGTGRMNLTRNSAADGAAAVSPDGKQVAFVSHRDGYGAIYLMNVDGSGQEQLVGRLSVPAGYMIGALAWSPTGRRLAFGLTHPQPGSFFSASFTYLVDLATRRARLLSGVGCGGGAAAFSPDGRFVAYGVVYCRSGGGEVKVARAADGRAELTVSGTFLGWAPRGSRLLLLRRTRNPKVQHVATVDRTGRGLRVLRGVPVRAAAWSPTGRLIAFSRSGKRPGIYVVRPGGRRPRRLVGLANVSSITWSPNGAWLAPTTARASRGGGVAAVYVVRASGRGLRRLGAARTAPVWSRDSRHMAFLGADDAARVASPSGAFPRRVTDPAADALEARLQWGGGSRLLFAASGREARSSRLLAVEPDGSRVRKITADGATPGRISTDGSRVLFVRHDDIWSARLDGSDQRQVTSGPALDGAPAWSPVGRLVAFARRPAGSSTSEIFLVDSTGGEARQLTNHDIGTHAGSPAWSPDGNWIAFLSFGGLFAVHPDGSGHHSISPLGPRIWTEPDWSPDGTKVALGGCAVAVVNADGSGYRELTGSGVREGAPSWSPDGSKIVFARTTEPCGGGLGLADDSDLWTINPDGTGETRLTSGPWPDTMPSWQPVRR